MIIFRDPHPFSCRMNILCLVLFLYFFLLSNSFFVLNFCLLVSYPSRKKYKSIRIENKLSKPILVIFLRKKKLLFLGDNIFLVLVLLYFWLTSNY